VELQIKGVVCGFWLCWSINRWLVYSSMNCSSCSSNNRGYLKFASLSLGCKLIINSIDVLWLKGRYKTVNSIYGRTILLVKLRLQLDTFLNYESSTLYNSFIIGSFQEHNNPSRIIDSYFNYSFDYQGASLRTFNTWEYFFSLLSTYAFLNYQFQIRL